MIGLVAPNSEVSRTRAAVDSIRWIEGYDWFWVSLSWSWCL